MKEYVKYTYQTFVVVSHREENMYYDTEFALLRGKAQEKRNLCACSASLF